MATQIDSVLESVVSAKHLPAIGGIILNSSGKQIYNKAFGTNNANSVTAPAYTNDTECLIMSCTKLITSVCALQLLEQGKLSLDEPVGKYQPWVDNLQIMTGWDENGRPVTRPSAKQMKILHLLTHTSGIPYDFVSSSLL